jgi:hypothetical protein
VSDTTIYCARCEELAKQLEEAHALYGKLAVEHERLLVAQRAINDGFDAWEAAVVGAKRALADRIMEATREAAE